MFRAPVATGPGSATVYIGDMNTTTQGFRVSAATGLHKGDRAYQQDQIELLVHPRVAGCALGLVADGMGGKSGGRGDSDDPNRVYNPPEVTERARVLSKPEPQYTEEARRADITGTVILRVVFSKTGEVTNIRALQPLGAGLTEKAIAAARQIRFVPARRNGQAVSMYMQLEYNFNLY